MQERHIVASAPVQSLSTQSAACRKSHDRVKMHVVEGGISYREGGAGLSQRGVGC